LAPIACQPRRYGSASCARRTPAPASSWAIFQPCALAAPPC
jgi:hypothetical protein